MYQTVSLAEAETRKVMKHNAAKSPAKLTLANRTEKGFLRFKVREGG